MIAVFGGGTPSEPARAAWDAGLLPRVTPAGGCVACERGTRTAVGDRPLDAWVDELRSSPSELDLLAAERPSVSVSAKAGADHNTAPTPSATAQVLIRLAVLARTRAWYTATTEKLLKRLTDITPQHRHQTRVGHTEH